MPAPSALLRAPVLFLLLLLPLPAANGQGYTFTRGDCNGDGGRDISDPVALLGTLFLPDGTPVRCHKACDVNDNGVLDIADVLYDLGYLYAGGPPPPPPIACGVDTTPDPLTCAGPTGDCDIDLPFYASVLEPPSSPPAAPCSCFAERIEEGRREYQHHLWYHSGEAYRVEVDLHVPGRGLDFAFVRTYRSRAGETTTLGHGWTHSYDIRWESASSGVALRDGHGRIDLLSVQSDGTYGAPGHFTSGTFDPEGRFVLTFGNGGTWTLRTDDDPLEAARGRIESIADRHGNTIAFFYDADGLAAITDTTGRSYSLEYDSAGLLMSLTDFDGRAVTYDYYDADDADGGEGDLRSVTSPPVIGTSTGNDFPLGKTTTYTYSVGFPDARLNHNLLSVTDPKGQTWLTYEYAPTLDPADARFDRIVEQGESAAQHLRSFHYQRLGDDLRVIRNDGRGTVDEFTYDASNRLVEERNYTGFADPTLVTTDIDNRPTGKLRPTDPDFFSTINEWNTDNRLVELTHTNGTITQYVHESDLLPGGPRVSRGNLRQVMRLPGSYTPIGGQSVLTSQFEYEPGYGGCCASDFLTLEVDPAGRTTVHAVDATGNRVQTVHPDPAAVEDFVYNAFGQLAQHVLPDNGAGVRRIDDYIHDDVTGLLLTETTGAGGPMPRITTYEYDTRGNIVVVTDPAGGTREYFYNALDQRIRERSRAIDPALSNRIERTYYYDANDNLVRTGIENRDENHDLDPDNMVISTLYEYDSMNRLVRICAESGSFDVPLSPPQLDCAGLPASEFVTNEIEWDASGNNIRALHGEAVNGNQPDNLGARLYDERDLLYRVIGGEGGPNPLTHQFDYDGNRNRVRVLSGLDAPAPRVTEYTYDAYDRLVSVTGPMGNVTSYEHDPSGNPIHRQTDGELVDGPGSVGNVRLQEATIAYGDLSRPGGGQFSHFDPLTQVPLTDGSSVWTTAYAPTSRLLSATDDNGATTTYEYDPQVRLARVVDPVGNEQTYEYDARGNIVSVLETDVATAAGVGSETFVSTFAYDGLCRLVAHTDNAGNSHGYAYDSRNNRVRHVDARGNVTRYEYDALDRLIVEERDITDTGDGSGVVVATLTTLLTWDDSSRLTSITDANGNFTSYTYDGLDRRVATTFANGTQHTFAWNSHGDLGASQDPNGTLLEYAHDGLGRVTSVAVTPGPGVAPDTTLVLYSYDGLSRLASASDDDSEVLRTHDSLGNLTSELLNGRLTTHSFSGAGNQLSTTCPGGRSLEFDYDVVGRLISVSDPGSGIIVSGYEYIGSDRVLSREDATGTTQIFEYDALRHVVAVSHVQEQPPGPALITATTSAWDPQYNRLSRQRVVTSSGSDLLHEYSYDSLDRLTRTIVSDPTGSVLRDTEYTLDGAGNRLNVTSGSCAGPYILDPAVGDAAVHQYTATGCDTRSYDAAGNLIARTSAGAPGVEYTYDFRDRLATLSDPFSGFYTYEYDALGRRTATTRDIAGGVERTEYFYDGFHVIEEQDGAGLTRATYVHGNVDDELLQMQRDLGAGPQDHYYRSDDLQAVVVLCNQAGDPVESYRYGDYGEPLISDAAGVPLPASQAQNPYLFQGRRYDPESGWYYFRTRFLDPLAGRFTSRDAAGIWVDPQARGNGFTFVGNNPWSHTDPTGEMTKAELINELADKTTLESKAAAERAFDSVISVGTEVELVGFGSFAANRRSARVGRSPRTGENIRISARRGVSFRPGRVTPRPSSQGDPDRPIVVGRVVASGKGTGVAAPYAVAAPYVPGGSVVSAALSSQSQLVLNGGAHEIGAQFFEPAPWFGGFDLPGRRPGPPATGSLRTASNLGQLRWQAPGDTRKRPGRVKYSDITLKRGFAREGIDPLLRKRPGRLKYGVFTGKKGYDHYQSGPLKLKGTLSGKYESKVEASQFKKATLSAAARARQQWIDTLLSNIMKTKHDTAKSAINNVR